MAYGDRGDLDVKGATDPQLDLRLRALADYDILDSEAEHGFDDIVFLARKTCHVPVSLISLIDRDRQWFKARSGFEACETPIEQSVCRHGLASRDLLVIPDLTADPRTCDNPMVVGGPKIRFYAGAPLITPDGTAIGMLCVMDEVARPDGLDADQRRALTALARQVINQLELRKALRATDDALAAERDETAMLRRMAQRLELAEEAGHVGAFEMDIATGVVLVSREFCRIQGLEERPSYTVAELDVLREGPVGLDFNSPEATAAQLPEQDEFLIHRASDGQPRWISLQARVVDGPDGRPSLFTGLITDITEQRAVNNEISHRLKNTLALVQAVASHTLREAVDAGQMQEFNRRIAALATAHDILLGRSRSSARLHETAEGVLNHLSIEDRVELAGDNPELSSRAVLTLSMLLHELGTNAMKYGALSVPGGKVEMTSRLEPRADGDWLVLEWQETGGAKVEEPKNKGLGTRLVERGLAPDGEADLRFDPAGLFVRMAAPMLEIGA